MIVFDSSSSYHTESSASYFEWSHTIGSGEDRMLIVAIATRVQWVDSVKFDGKDCTFKTSEQPGSDVNAELWYMPEADLPESGTYTIRVNLTGSQQGIGIASSWENVFQTPLDSYRNNGNSVDSSVEIVEVMYPIPSGSSIIVDCVAKQSAGSTTEADDQTNIGSEIGPVGAGGSSYKEWPGSSTTMEWEVNDIWAAVAMVIRDVSVKTTMRFPMEGDAVTPDYTPNIYFTGIDPDDDDIEYEVQIDIDSEFRSAFDWYDDTPGASSNWGKCSVSGESILAAERGYRLWLYEDYTWSEQRPVGNQNRLWSDVGISGTKKIASDNKGGGARLWYFDGASWAETRPCGDVNKNWVACDIDGDYMVAAYSSGRLYYTTDGGSNWTEQQPAGDVDKAWKDVCLSGDKILACVNGGRLYYYNGSSWSEVQPDGDSDRNWRCVAVDGDKMLAGQYALYTSDRSKLFHYDGSDWYELVLNDTVYSGEEFTKWTGVSIAGDYMMACGEYAGAYFYDGDKWMEVFPTGVPAGIQAWDGCDISEYLAVAGYESGGLYVGWVGSEEIPIIRSLSTVFTGFSRSGDTHPFDNGEEVCYTVQFSQHLQPGNYYVRVRGLGSGTGDEGEWATHTLTVSDFSIHDTVHVVTSDSVHLTQHNILPADNCTHVLTSNQVKLVYHNPWTILLKVADCTHPHYSDTIELVFSPPSRVLRYMGVHIDEMGKALRTSKEDIHKIDGVIVNQD